MFIKSTSQIAAAIVIALSSSTAFADNQLKSPKFWWPEQLNLSPLRQHAAESNPMGKSYNYAEAFNKLDLAAVKR